MATFIQAVREKVSDNAQDFADEVFELARGGHPVALKLVMERAYPQKVEIEHSGNEEQPVQLVGSVPEELAGPLRELVRQGGD